MNHWYYCRLIVLVIIFILLYFTEYTTIHHVFLLEFLYHKSIPWMVLRSKSKKVLFSQGEPVPQRSFMSEDIPARFPIYYTLTSPPSASYEIFTISYCPCTERISVWLVLDFQTRFIWLISTFKLSKPTALVKVPVVPTNRNSNHHHLRSQAKRLHYEVRIVTISIRQNLERSHDSKSLSCKYRLKKASLAIEK